MTRRFGLPSQVTARDQVQKSFPAGKVQPLPPGSAGEATASAVGITDANPLTFFVIGDHGGVSTPGPQNAVSYAMQRASGPAAAFVYSVGDIVYFHGEADQYQPQFFEPYAHLQLPIVGIPGNHDGDVAEDDSGNPTGRQPLDTFLANFCTATPQPPPCDPQLEFGRHTQTLPWCFPAGTLIRKADGSECPIEDIRLLEEVVTAERRVGKVLQAGVRWHEGHLVRIKLWGHAALRATPEHPILTRRGYVAAGDLRLDDWVAQPKYRPPILETIGTARHLTVAEQRQKAASRRSAGVLGRGSAVIQISEMKQELRLTEGLGRIIGFFLAEGSVSAHTLRWDFGASELDTHVAELVRLLRAELGVEPRVSRPRATAARVVVSGTAHARLFESLCGTGAHRKHLHPDICAGPAEFMEAMLMAWADGDGYLKKGRIRSVSVSRELAIGMFDIAQSLGLLPTLRHERPSPAQRAGTTAWAKIRGGSNNMRDWWSVEFYPRRENPKDSRGSGWRLDQDDGYVWRKVRALEAEEFVGHVYNLNVEGDESYVADGIGVHNCDWTLALEAVTIVGIYTNVPEGGHLETSQTDWLAQQLGAAPADRPLIVALHHPPLSADAFHGGSKTMATALTQAFATAARYPDLILTGHVHDYQRFTWTIDGHAIPTIVQGNSGYHNLHRLAADAKPGLDLGNGVVFEYGDASEYGFLTLTVSGGKITGSYTGVKPGTMPDGSDATVTPGKDTF